MQRSKILDPTEIFLMSLERTSKINIFVPLVTFAAAWYFSMTPGVLSVYSSYLSISTIYI